MIQNVKIPEEVVKFIETYGCVSSTGEIFLPYVVKRKGGTLLNFSEAGEDMREYITKFYKTTTMKDILEKFDALIALFPNTKEIVLGADWPDKTALMEGLKHNDLVGSFDSAHKPKFGAFSMQYKGVSFHIMETIEIANALKAAQEA